jgi:TfoX/Sxy family transcriptional regulator of competence genes
MSYDEGLAQRVREALGDRPDVSEKRMFGGLAFLLRGNLCVGIMRSELMVRVGPEAYDAMVQEPHAREMDFTGRPMKGLVYVASMRLQSDGELHKWVARGASYATSLPAK